MTVIENTTYNDHSDIKSTKRVGERANDSSSLLYGIPAISDLQFPLKRVGTSGTLTAGLFNGTTLKHTFWTKSVSSLGTSFAWTTETSTPYSTATIVGDYVGLISDESAGDMGYVGLSTTAVFDGTNSSLCENGTPNTTNDIGFKVTTGTPPPSTSSTFYPPPPAYITL